MADRFIRQTSLKEFGDVNQQKLTNAKVLVVGLGGLGIPVVQYLNAMGVGTLGLVEQDMVELTNLQRQVLYSENDIGSAKLDVVQGKLKLQNSNTTLIGYDTFLTKANALEIVSDYDIVVDATDNFPTRYLINDACVILNKPFIYGALHGFEGQVSVFNYENGPTYRCLFPVMPSTEEIPNCNDNGVLGIIPGIIGNLQALEVVKVITGIGKTLSGTLLVFSGIHNSFTPIKFKRQEAANAITTLKDSYEEVGCSPEENITVEELQRLLHADQSLQLIDVRSPEEFALYKLPNSINIPLDMLDQSLEKIALKQPVYLICQSGKRSQIAVKNLKELHPNTTFLSIFGGINQFLATCS